MISSLFVLTVVTFLGSSVMVMSMGGFHRSREDMLRVQALDAAEAGIDRGIALIRDDSDYRVDGSIEELPNGTRFRYSIEDGAGDNNGRIVIESLGEATVGARTQRRRLLTVVTYEPEDVGCWGNLLFCGVGQAGKSINGNVVMHGKIQLLGDGEPYTDVDGDLKWDSAELYTDLNLNGQYDIGEVYVDADQDGHRDGKEPFTDFNGNNTCDPPLTVTDMATEIGGTAHVGNNYDGIPAVLSAKIPPCPTQYFGGEEVQSLSTKVRVKHGRVDINSGSATIGDPNVSGGSPCRKETVNGVYVSDGFGGNHGASQVHSDNGTSNSYDLGNTVTFPDVILPCTVDGVDYDCHMDYLEQEGLTINGPLVLKPNQDYGPVSDGNGNKLYVNGTTKQIEVQGIVRVVGDLTLEKASGSGNETFNYYGRGTLASTGNIRISTHLLPVGAFPTTDALGILARKQLGLATGSGDSQLNMIGAFYAQEKVTTGKQTKLAGAIVSSYFDVKNVPHLYHVPKLAELNAQGKYQYLPPGMPGGVAPTMVGSFERNGVRELVAGAW
jgi:hypothetical protein